MSKIEKIAGNIKFDKFYKDIYKERWDELKESLLKENDNKFKIPLLESPFYIDYSSYIASTSLPLLPKDNLLLDMCSSPGGKALTLATRIKGEGEIICNELSRERRKRLKKNIDLYLKEEWKKNIHITGYDGTKIGLYDKEKYTSILLDAPCSEERHVIKSEKYLSIWSPNRPKRLAITQYALLSSALLSVKRGGYILYSTCSINPGENEDIINKLFIRHKSEIEEISVLNEDIFMEKREYGKIILPDSSGGFGPLYFALIRKKNE